LFIVKVSNIAHKLQLLAMIYDTLVNCNWVATRWQ